MCGLKPLESIIEPPVQIHYHSLTDYNVRLRLNTDLQGLLVHVL